MMFEIINGQGSVLIYSSLPPWDMTPHWQCAPIQDCGQSPNENAVGQSCIGLPGHRQKSAKTSQITKSAQISTCVAHWLHLWHLVCFAAPDLKLSIGVVDIGHGGGVVIVEEAEGLRLLHRVPSHVEVDGRLLLPSSAPVYILRLRQ